MSESAVMGAQSDQEGAEHKVSSVQHKSSRGSAANPSAKLVSLCEEAWYPITKCGTQCGMFRLKFS